MSKYWIISDSHFNHTKIAEYTNRPENWKDQMLKGLFSLPKDSVLIHLGDICVGGDQEVHDEILPRIPSQSKILVMGNHDRKSKTWYLNNGWDFVCDEFVLNIYGTSIGFVHEPSKGWRYSRFIHGHSHNSVSIKEWNNHQRFLYAPEYYRYQPLSLRTIVDKLWPSFF
jgi:calcineurin-like phosphoesterase family protein